MKSIAFALVAWYFLSTFLVESFRVISGSMENTLLVGDVLFVNKLLYGARVPLIGAHLPAFRDPRHGEIVVFESVVEPGLILVKRLMGLPGDTLAMESGRIRRNGQFLDEPYVVHSDPSRSAEPSEREHMRELQLSHYIGANPDGYHPDVQDWGPFVVPKDSLFMMGDNRDLSLDSRFWGFVPRSHVRGRVLVLYYSYDASSYRPLPLFSAPRLERIFSIPK